MSEVDTEHEAVNRLYELVRNGETDNGEFDRLESMVYERLLQTYAVGEPPVNTSIVTQTMD